VANATAEVMPIKVTASPSPIAAPIKPGDPLSAYPIAIAIGNEITASTAPDTAIFRNAKYASFNLVLQLG
jgi:hypothetical protein